LKPGIPLMISSHPKSSEQVQARLPGLTCTKVLHHQRLGGLMNAQIVVMCGGKGVERDSSVKPGSQFHLECPLGAFLEPSIRLVEC